MKATDHSTQAVIVLAADGTQIRCAVEWVDEPMRSGAAQCLAERWVFRAGDTVHAGPPVSEISCHADLEETVNVWWRQRK